jgi:uncharacterized membrane protein YkvA (DUF1232 family)
LPWVYADQVPWSWIALGIGVSVFVWALAVAALAIAGRRSEARALVRFIPDCIVLVRRLVADPDVPRRHKLVLALLLGYLAMPFDVVPDFIPVAGQLDDALVVALALRYVLRSAGPQRLADHWPGPPESLAVITRIAF